uniref:Leucine-rich repeat protein (LRRP) n=1 Tax=Trypanosoma congolense (strain IL3000) TaxID=1068625 RepID=G0UP95_TRYCI|nr:conserved hypothetical protein [Trypanosoma congolense IL3000]
MQKQYVTLDAAYKFTLWYSLLRESQGKLVKSTELVHHHLHVQEVAVSLIRTALPRQACRGYCLSGACDRGSLAHRALHFGRPEIHVADERDDALYCLAHATARIGRPLELCIKNYCSTASLSGNGYGGLRCVLRHVQLRSLTLSGVSSFPDAQRVVEELSVALTHGLKWLRRLSIGGIPAYVDVAQLLHSLIEVDTVTDLKLEDCGIQSVQGVVVYLSLSKRLRRLSLRGNKGICEGVRAVASGVAACRSLQHFDIGLCQLRDEHLREFLLNLDLFARRDCFSLDVSNNALSRAALGQFVEAPLIFRQCLAELDLSGHNFGGAGSIITSMLLDLPALHGIILDNCEIGPSDIQRLSRVFSQTDRTWSRLSLRGNRLTLIELRRIVTTSFAENSRLCVAGNNLGVSVQKLCFSSVLPYLVELDLSICNLGIAGVLQLASNIEKTQPVPLRVLRLDNNQIGSEGVRGRGGLQFLGRALRSSYSPRLEVLSLAYNKLSLRPLLTLVDQASSTLRELHISYSSIANDGHELADLVGRVACRQKGSNAFCKLDIWALQAPGTAVSLSTISRHGWRSKGLFGSYWRQSDGSHILHLLSFRAHQQLPWAVTLAFIREHWVLNSFHHLTYCTEAAFFDMHGAVVETD